MASTGLHISISAETVAHLGPIPISNSMLTSLIVSVLLIAFAVAVNRQLKAKGRPSGMQNIAEMLIEAFYNLIQGVTGSQKRTRLFFPLVTTFFLFILFNNWLGLFPGVGTIGFREAEVTEEHASSVQLIQPVLASEPAELHTTEVITENGQLELHSEETDAAGLPGGTVEEVANENHAEETEKHGPAFVPYFRAGTADLNTTVALAIISVAATQFFGIQFLKLGYFSKFINFSSPITFFVGILETVLEFAKIISFAFRLFGNIFAGEVLLAVISFLVPVVAPMPFYGLEVIVGVIQALVFAMLSVVFFNMATIGHSEEH
jgi:F-type H+-transporting ATPase subunit a